VASFLLQSHFLDEASVHSVTFVSETTVIEPVSISRVLDLADLI
jgi:hypothetical protein